MRFQRPLYCLLLLLIVGTSVGVEVTVYKSEQHPLSVDLKLGAKNQDLKATIISQGARHLKFFWSFEEELANNGDGSILLKVENGNIQIQKDGYHLRAPHSLTIDTVEKSNAGVYHVQAFADTEDPYADKKYYTVRVVYAPTKPVCQFPYVHTLIYGHEQELKCVSSDAVPQAEYKWFRNGVELPADSSTDPNYSNASFVINKDSGTLTFKKVNATNGGSYYCKAYNVIGESECHPAKLVVLANPKMSALMIGISVGGTFLVVLILILVVYCIWKYGTCKSDAEEVEMYDVGEEWGSNDINIESFTPQLRRPSYRY